MEVLSHPVNVLENFNNIKQCKSTSKNFTAIPVVDLLDPDAKTKIVEACKEFGFFKVINHDVSVEFMEKLESEAVKFFNLPQLDKEKSGPPNPFGYGNKKISLSGDVGWVEYLPLGVGPEIFSKNAQVILPGNSEGLWSLVNDYVSAVRNMMCEVLEMITVELKIGPKDVLSRLIKDEKSDSCFRVNHYPPCPELQPSSDRILIGFGEHTDPQISSVLRSNTSGLQICLKDGTWVSVPPDHSSFFFNVGDSLQVITNGRFRSVKYRVLTHSLKSRISMVYFGGPPLSEKITALSSLMDDGEEKLYEEFTWSENKKSAYKTRLGENRLGRFEKSHDRSQITKTG
ncbi:gibberellin 2-beta-dioxygenase-like [Olea europaea subsp. europaea]|uniref:gibberellin 2beta-dioxygenase n=1 Tax=Olea europaea subsp. europaea TaxID=158383 RepID=A0A8S0UGI7_OLEEU|nr:gibberellin 2-beta-dioxygenase-like [Olea europaea subsp. europaea]CAA3019390.1 gibberellin 2-beta-dioxygenase-like [Olea europaea subsp. europaea]